MPPSDFFSVVLALIALANAGMWAVITSQGKRINQVQSDATDRIDSAHQTVNEKADSQYQALHDRISDQGKNLQRLEIHIAERYVRDDQLEKAVRGMESGILKEVHSVKNQVELVNEHITQLIQALGTDKK